MIENNKIREIVKKIQEFRSFLAAQPAQRTIGICKATRSNLKQSVRPVRPSGDEILNGAFFQRVGRQKKYTLYCDP